MILDIGSQAISPSMAAIGAFLFTTRKLLLRLFWILFNWVYDVPPHKRLLYSIIGRTEIEGRVERWHGVGHGREAGSGLGVSFRHAKLWERSRMWVRKRAQARSGARTKARSGARTRSGEWGRSGARERMTVPSARPLYLISIFTPDADFVKPIDFCPMREPRPHLPHF